MSLPELDNFYLQKEEPISSCLLALREMIFSQDKEIIAAWKYGMPFFLYTGKMFCYLWVHKKLGLPYIGIVEGERLNHPDLIIEKRARMKILLIDPSKDLPKRKINSILKETVDLYRNGIVKVDRVHSNG